MAAALKAQRQLTLVFTRLCGPNRAKVDATITETSTNGRFNINSLPTTDASMRQFDGC